MKCPHCGRRTISDFTSTRIVNPYNMLEAGVAVIKGAAMRLKSIGKCETAYDLYGEPMNLISMIANSINPILPHQIQTGLNIGGQEYRFVEAKEIKIPMEAEI